MRAAAHEIPRGPGSDGTDGRAAARQPGTSPPPPTARSAATATRAVRRGSAAPAATARSAPSAWSAPRSASSARTASARDPARGTRPAANQPRTLAGGTVAADPRLVTKILLALNVAVFVVVHVKPALLPDLTLFGRANLYYGGPPEGVAEGQWYRLVTSMFLHQEVWHIAFNMLGLWWLGGPLEAALGPRPLPRALSALRPGGQRSHLSGSAAPNQPSLGASGAIFGLLGATAVLDAPAELRHAAGPRAARAEPALHLHLGRTSPGRRMSAVWSRAR